MSPRLHVKPGPSDALLTWNVQMGPIQTFAKLCQTQIRSLYSLDYARI